MATQSTGRKPVQAWSIEQLLDFEEREFILIGGKDGVGKSSAIVSMALYVFDTKPDAKFFYIDTENGFRKIFKTFPTPPRNLVYFHCNNMEEVLDAFDQIQEQMEPGDWVAVESMTKIWELCQNLGYEAVSGVDKTKFMLRRRQAAKAGDKKTAGTVTPDPENLWAITKEAHDVEFVDIMQNWEDVNVVWTTTMAKPREQRANRKESRDRVDFRNEFGIDSNMGGFPRLPYIPDTVIILNREKGMVYGKVIKDRSALPWLDYPEFDVETNLAFAEAFFDKYRDGVGMEQ